MDGVTAALVRFNGEGAKVLRHRTYPYSGALRESLSRAARLTTPELSRLNFALGEAFAAAGRKLAGGVKLDVVGSHGQTVWHGSVDEPRNTLQLGEPSVIAERLKTPTVADFRPRDMAAGGEGAPLVPAFDLYCFGGGPLRAVQNIGGIANVSFVGKGRLWSAFDTGPGNSLLDAACRLSTGGRMRMDEGGRLAARGEADRAKVERLLADPYFKRRPPKSLDKDYFGEAYLRRHFSPLTSGRLSNLLASLSLLTARSIARAYERFSPKAAHLLEMIVSGGGAHNDFLMKALRDELKGLPVHPSDRYGIPAMAKEAAAFAWMAMEALGGRPNNCPVATGADGPRILGKIIPA